MKDILEHIKCQDPDQLPKLKRVVDLCRKASKQYEVVTSDFLSPDIHDYLPYIIHHFKDLSYELQGGYDEAEYKKLILYPDYMVDIESQILVIDIKYQEKYGQISHRDVLGAVLGLGLKRDVVGDILLEPGHVQVMTSETTARFIRSQLSKIGRVHVDVSMCQTDEIMKKDEQVKMIFSTVKSVRLDAVIASGYNVSRSKAVDLIKAEKVKLNHNYCSQTSKELNVGDLISIRGLGRIRLQEINGLSKKERYKIEIKKYI